MTKPELKTDRRSANLTATLIASALLLIASSASAAEPQIPNHFFRTVLGDSVAQPAQGRWNLPSYGMLFDFRSKTVDVYDRAGKLCWRDSEYVDAPSVNDLVPFFAVATSGSSIFFASAPDGTRYHVLSAIDIPATCAGSPDRTSPEYIFNAVTASLMDFYPFTREHHVNWADRATRLKPRAVAARTDGDLVAVLTELFRGVYDAHTSISGKLNGKPFRIRSFRGRDFKELEEAFAHQTRYDILLDWVSDAWMPGEYDRATAALLPGTRRQALGRALIWGKLEGNVGYLAINQMADFGKDTDVAGDRALLGPALDQALADLKDTNALVLDISHNLGGDDEVSADIAARFADKLHPAYTKQAFHAGVAQRFQTIPYSGLRYLKPVYLLTSELTASAAEVFTLRMRELPHVIQIGEPTQGIFSDSTEKGLPNGWILAMSTEIYRDSHGRNYEGIGLTPQIPYRVIGVRPAGNEYQEAIRWVGSLAAKRTSRSIGGSYE